MSNSEVRLWYKAQVKTIPERNEKWRQDGVAADCRARCAFELRRAARVGARRLMRRWAAALLRLLDQARYGNPDGPDLEQLVVKLAQEGISGERLYEKLIASAGRTNLRVDRRSLRNE